MPSLPARPKLSQGPTTKQSYDVAVLGSHLGGVLCAALLQKRGYRTVFVEHDGVGQGYEHQGFVLPYAPFFSPPLKAMPLFEAALTELGIHTTFQRAQRACVPELQVVLPGARVDLFTEATKRGRELTRAFQSAAAGPALAALHAHHEKTDGFFRGAPPLPAGGFFDRWELRKRMKQHPSLEEALVLEGASPLPELAALAAFATHLADPQSALAQSRPLSQTLLSAQRYPGGREAIRELLVRKLRDAGGEVLSHEGGGNPVVETLSFDGGKLVGLKLLESDNLYQANYFVAATDGAALRRLVPDKKKHRKLAEELEDASLAGFLFTVCWVLPEKALPRGLGERVLYRTGDEELPSLLLQLQAARKVGAKADEEELCTLTAGAFIPATARERGEPHLQKVAERMNALLDVLLPFSRQRALLVSSPFLDAAQVRGARLLPHPHYAPFEGSVLGVAGLSPRTSVKNLFLANREVLPGLGLEGELAAGVRAADLIGGSLRKKDPLKG